MTFHSDAPLFSSDSDLDPPPLPSSKSRSSKSSSSSSKTNGIFGDDPWNALCVLGLRVYSQSAELKVRVVRGDEDEEEGEGESDGGESG